jgi:hypothetical protein
MVEIGDGAAGLVVVIAVALSAQRGAAASAAL